MASLKGKLNQFSQPESWSEWEDTTNLYSKPDCIAKLQTKPIGRRGVKRGLTKSVFRIF